MCHTIDAGFSIIAAAESVKNVEHIIGFLLVKCHKQFLVTAACMQRTYTINLLSQRKAKVLCHSPFIKSCNYV